MKQCRILQRLAMPNCILIIISGVLLAGFLLGNLAPSRTHGHDKTEDQTVDMDLKYKIINVGYDLGILMLTIDQLSTMTDLLPVPSMFYIDNPYGDVKIADLSRMGESESMRRLLGYLRSSGVYGGSLQIPLESSPSAYHDFEWLMTFHKRAIDQRLGDDFFERTGTTILPLDPFRNDGLPYRYYILPYRGGFAHIVASNGPNRVQDITGDLALRIIEGEDSIEHYIYDPTNGTVSGGDIVMSNYSRPFRDPITGQSLENVGRYAYLTAFALFLRQIPREEAPNETD